MRTAKLKLRPIVAISPSSTYRHRSFDSVSSSPKTQPRRFVQYDLDAKKTLPTVGPGSYDLTPHSKNTRSPLFLPNLSISTRVRTLSDGPIIRVDPRPKLDIFRALKVRVYTRSLISKPKEKESVCTSTLDFA